MAVYTPVSAEEFAALLARYNLGELRSAKGIAEGVENSNFLVETDRARFVLTLYERRVDEADLPFFLQLLDHLADRGLPVARGLRDRGGRQVQRVAGRLGCLFPFLPGVSPTKPTPAQAQAAGATLAALRREAAGFPGERANDLGPPGWAALAARCGERLDEIAPGLRAQVDEEVAFLLARWPAELPRGVIHADLFPDNVLMLGDTVTGVIDFYFACTEMFAYDLVVSHAAWCFALDGRGFDPAVSAALLDGYGALAIAERAALPLLARGACLRFLLTRAWDWLHTPADALVTRKDPLAYLRRLDFYAANEQWIAA